MVSLQLLKEIQTIFQEDYGVNITEVQTKELAQTLIAYFNVLVKNSN